MPASRCEDGRWTVIIKAQRRSGSRTSIVELLTPEAIVEKVAYLVANPVEAGLVQHARD